MDELVWQWAQRTMAKCDTARSHFVQVVSDRCYKVIK